MKRCIKCLNYIKNHKNKSGYCNFCYDDLYRESKNDIIKRKTYHCPRCDEDIFSERNNVTKRNTARGYCYKCLEKEVTFKPVEKSCIKCGNKFIINERMKKNIKVCQNCNGVSGRPKTTEQFIFDAQKIHGNHYSYEKVNYINCMKKIIITCKIHGDFLINPNNHLSGRGCPKCCLFVSRGEVAIMEWFKENKINYIHQHKFNDCINPITNYKLKYDFYIPAKDILIEYDGEQHTRIGAKVRNHILTENEIKNIQYRDTIKTNYALLNNIKLIRIPYTELKNVDNILRKEIYG